jgi:outer membrane lipoprotein
MRALAFTLLVAILTAGCASVPKSLQSDRLSTVTPSVVRDGAGAGVGEQVRWGGSILEVKPEAGETCITVLSRPLDDSARPLVTDASFGRFVACGQGFYDPAVYAKDRSLTVLGTVDGVIEGAVAGASYRFPKVRIEGLNLWPIIVYATPPFYGPYWGGPLWYGPSWGPFWYGPAWGPYWYGPGPFWGW